MENYNQYIPNTAIGTNQYPSWYRPGDPYSMNSYAGYLLEQQKEEEELMNNTAIGVPDTNSYIPLI